ncbi:MAG: choice-of-anchor U domain-containing protein [Dehalococcoidia bacterium]|jgi:hypothetical protein
MLTKLRPIAYLLLTILVLPLAFLSIFPNPASASGLNTVYVNGTTGDDINYDGSSPVHMSGSVGPKLTIQAGIGAVNAGGTVNVAAGTYGPTATTSITKPLTLAGAGSAATIVDGGALSSPGAVIDINLSPSGTVVISGLTIQHGPFGGLSVSGGVFNPTVTVNDCVIVNNSSPDVGAGVFIIDGNVTINRCNISSNVVNFSQASPGKGNFGDGFHVNLQGSGGGIFVDGSTLTLNSCTVNNNVAMGADAPFTGMGGGIAAVDNTTLTMGGCTVNSNTAYAWGGGLFYELNNSGETALPTISNCNFTNNLAVMSGGAAYFLGLGFFDAAQGNLFDAAASINSDSGFTGTLSNNKSTYGSFSSPRQFGQGVKLGQVLPTMPVPSMNNCNIVNNQAGNSGGGVTLTYSAILLNGCTISGNATEFIGGGVCGLIAFSEVVNCTVSGNTLTYPNRPPGLLEGVLSSKPIGGTPLHVQNTGLPVVSNVGGGFGLVVGIIFFDCDTIANNSTSLSDNNSYGGGLFFSRDSIGEFDNTIVANNRAFQTSTNNCLNRGSIYSDGHNIDSQNSCGFTDPTDQVNTDPLLGPLQNNGGPTQTCAIGDNSPAFDRGSNGIEDMPPTDQRGVTRPQGAFCDIGAYELVLTPSETTTPITGPGGTVTFTTGSGGISGLTALPVDACSTLTAPVAFPYGIFSFNIVGIAPGATVPVTINLPLPIAGNVQYWKCGGASGWVDVTSLVTYIPGDTKLILNLTDGGLGDADHLANGRIVDPGGPAFILSGSRKSSSGYIALPQQPVALPSLAVQTAALSASKVDPGMPVTVTATVANKGAAEGSIRLQLLVNSREEASQLVTVVKGGSTPVKFTIVKDEPGTYTVYVGGITAGSFTVNDWVNPDKILFISSGLLFCALLVGLYIAWRRQRYY